MPAPPAPIIRESLIPSEMCVSSRGEACSILSTIREAAAPPDPILLKTAPVVPPMEPPILLSAGAATSSIGFAIGAILVNTSFALVKTFFSQLPKATYNC